MSSPVLKEHGYQAKVIHNQPTNEKDENLEDQPKLVPTPFQLSSQLARFYGAHKVPALSHPEGQLGSLPMPMESFLTYKGKPQPLTAIQIAIGHLTIRATHLYKQYRLTLQTTEHTEGLRRSVARTELKPSAWHTLSTGAWVPGEGLY